MYIGFTQDRNEFLKIKKQEKWNENYHQNIKLRNFDRVIRYVLVTIYIIAIISLYCYSIQNSVPILPNDYKKLR